MLGGRTTARPASAEEVAGSVPRSDSTPHRVAIDGRNQRCGQLTLHGSPHALLCVHAPCRPLALRHRHRERWGRSSWDGVRCSVCTRPGAGLARQVNQNPIAPRVDLRSSALVTRVAVAVVARDHPCRRALAHPPLCLALGVEGGGEEIVLSLGAIFTTFKEVKRHLERVILPGGVAVVVVHYDIFVAVADTAITSATGANARAATAVGTHAATPYSFTLSRLNRCSHRRPQWAVVVVIFVVVAKRARQVACARRRHALDRAQSGCPIRKCTLLALPPLPRRLIVV